MSKKLKKILPWIVWGTGAAFFFFQYVVRLSGSVMVPELMRSFSVSAFTLGGLNAYFYYAYVGMQLPVGVLMDRYGARKLLVLMTLIVALGCGIFGLSHHLLWAKVGRLLMGIGSAFAFIGTIKLITEWFDEKHFGFLTTSTQAIGMFGAILGGAPIAMFVGSLGWRAAMGLFSAIFMVLMLLMFVVIRDREPQESQASSVHEIPMRQSITQVMSNPKSWINGLYAGFMYAPMAAFSELWGVSFLKTVYHVHTEFAAFCISFVFLGWTIGGPFVGWLSDRMGRRKPLLIISALLSFVFLGAIILEPPLPLPWLLGFLFLFGVSNTGVGISYTVGGEINSRSVSGTSVAFTNMASVLIGTILQPLIGWLLDFGWDGTMVHGAPYYSSADYHRSMLLLVGCLILSILFALLAPETYGKNLVNDD